jgi:ribosome recycling factor
MSLSRQEAENKMKKTIKNLSDEFVTLRTGRASSAIVERVMVDAYGTKSPLNQVANISVPEARLVVIQPWDKGLLAEIEKAIMASDIGITPSNDGKVIRLNFPPLTEERRKELVKQAKAMAETNRVAIRNIRRDALEAIKKEQKDGKLTEDEAKKATDDLQKLTDHYIKEIDKLSQEKEKEIMEV